MVVEEEQVVRATVRQSVLHVPAQMRIKRIERPRRPHPRHRMQIDRIKPQLAQQPMLLGALVVKRVAIERDQVRRDIRIPSPSRP
ncbi:hypothetical protein [Burkholderia multivorans]|uniref:hypothetical protein n=1 Tax=Burkholderia multivorans TaxID=87883 RepID=UPI0021598C80|nr:hypothetical protein [Burkholderia multivorans]